MWETVTPFYGQVTRLGDLEPLCGRNQQERQHQTRATYEEDPPRGSDTVPATRQGEPRRPYLSATSVCSDVFMGSVMLRLERIVPPLFSSLCAAW